jgi:hypothetical protein
VLDLWWQTTKLTYLYYWHQRIWAVLAVWAVLILLLILLALIGEELWRAGYKAALQSAAAPETVHVPAKSVPAAEGSVEKRRFLAPPSQAFPGIRRLFSGQRDRS